jgi:predicted RNA-binding protein with PUA-like domain
VIREHYPDPGAKPGEPWVAVDVKALAPLPKPVTLDAIKTEPKLKAMMLVNNTRLSVQPVTDAEWKLVCKIGGLA